MAEKVKILTAKLDNLSRSSLLRKIKAGGVLLTPNVDHLMKLQKDKEFQEIYNRADFVVCDSKVLYWSAKLLGQEVQEKISGFDFFPAFYQHYQDDPEIKIFLLGGTEQSVKIAQNKINSKLRNPIVVGSYSPAMNFEENELENRRVIDLINSSPATVLAVGLGAPKQEKWIYKYKEQLPNIKIFLALGATINFEAGLEKRSPQWISEAGLEWLYRLLHNPQRLWKRYSIEGLPFFWLIFKQKINADFPLLKSISKNYKF